MYAKYAVSDTIRDTEFERLMIMMKDPSNIDDTNAFIKDLRQSISAYVD